MLSVAELGGETEAKVVATDCACATNSCQVGQLGCSCGHTTTSICEQCVDIGAVPASAASAAAPPSAPGAPQCGMRQGSGASVRRAGCPAAPAPTAHASSWVRRRGSGSGGSGRSPSRYDWSHRIKINTEEKGKGRRWCLGTEYIQLFCTRTIWRTGWNAPGLFEEMDEIILFFKSS